MTVAARASANCFTPGDFLLLFIYLTLGSSSDNLMIQKILALDRGEC